ncbi:hypothetical protein BCR36DRAFT_367607 [Piromyces finnis]|uniref:Uncharacterized protein n=1 Tax=Piromyces finnis TaxID=1754191 RepID=A0A1Y1VJR1_9FUNG|nr:hypothetical protein BCR36DRAFT_367607 [Piromyces finnis]|eukprot:ORX56636.1 hypothetical protein BCR36DRAFT_367607 [Piromyces finnis]
MKLAYLLLAAVNTLAVLSKSIDSENINAENKNISTVDESKNESKIILSKDVETLHQQIIGSKNSCIECYHNGGLPVCYPVSACNCCMHKFDDRDYCKFKKYC